MVEEFLKVCFDVVVRFCVGDIGRTWLERRESRVVSDAGEELNWRVRKEWDGRFRTEAECGVPQR